MGFHDIGELMHVLLYELLWATLLGSLTIAALIDLRTGVIPWPVTFLGAVAGVALHAGFQGWSGGFGAFLSGLIWYGIGLTLWRFGKIGGGDWDLLAMVAVYAGLFGPVLVLLFGSVVQASVFAISFARGDMRLERPFAPALLGGAVLLLILQWR